MNTLIWRVRQWTRYLGSTGLTGLGLIILAAVVFMTQVWPLEHRVSNLQQRYAEAQLAAEAIVTGATPHVTQPVAALPPESEAAWTLGKLEQLALAHGIELSRGQYSVASVTGTSLTRWQLALPVSADYPSLRAFVAAALETLPNLALDEIKLKRERIENTDLEVELRWSLFVETAS